MQQSHAIESCSVAGSAPEVRMPEVAIWLIAWMGGILCGWLVPKAAVWWILALALVLVATFMMIRRRRSAAARRSLLAIVAVSASWLLLLNDHVGADDIGQFLAHDLRMAEVMGTVEAPVETRHAHAGTFASLSYEAPNTLNDRARTVATSLCRLSFA